MMMRRRRKGLVQQDVQPEPPRRVPARKRSLF
jgi:hypothetical protein